jgi:hypothetical protein
VSYSEAAAPEKRGKETRAMKHYLMLMLIVVVGIALYELVLKGMLTKIIPATA